MIYYCDNCVNRNDCPENQEQYKKACQIMAATLYEIEHNPETHCFYSARMKCDYWIEDKELWTQGEMESCR